MEQLLIQLGINLASSVIYDLVKMYHRSTTNPTIDGLKNYLASKLVVENAVIKANTIIDFMAKNGDILIQGTSIYAPQSVQMNSSQNTSLVFGNNSVSSTDKTSVEAGYGAQIVASGGAGIRQNEDGSIILFA